MPNSDQVMRWAGITRRQLDHWVAKGFLKPVVIPAERMGGKIYDWSMTEAKTAEHMGKLVSAGIPPAMAHRFATGDTAALNRLLRALGPLVAELRWRHYGEAPVAEPEPCG